METLDYGNNISSDIFATITVQSSRQSRFGILSTHQYRLTPGSDRTWSFNGRQTETVLFSTEEGAETP